MLAECGGMMYLCDTITGSDGKAYPMVGILKQEATMEQMKLKLGYREVRVKEQGIRGHEFHYSRVMPGNEKIPVVGTVYNAKGMVVDTCIYSYKKCIGKLYPFLLGRVWNRSFFNVNESKMTKCPKLYLKWHNSGMACNLFFL